MHGRTVGRTLASTAIAALCAAALAACGSSGGTSAATASASTSAEGKQFTIGWVPPTVAPWEKAMRAGIEQQAKALGMDLVVAGGQFDPKVQITAVDSLVSRDVDAIVIWPLDEQGIQPALDRAREKDIPIITINAPNGRADVNFQTDDEATTAKLAQYVASKVDKPCKVAILEGVSQVSILKARNEGYAKGAQEAGCEIVDRQTNTNDTPEKAGEIAQAWKTRFGSDLSGVLAVNDPSALAVAAQTDDDFKPLIVGLNGDSDMIKALEQGRVAATAALLSPEIGNGVAFAAHELLDGDSVPSTVAADYFQVNAENVGEYQSYEDRLQAPMDVSLAGGTLETKLG